MPSPFRPIAAALCLTVLAMPSLASPPVHAETPHSLPVQAEGDMLDELERRADELSDTARRTIEEFVNLIGPMLVRLSRLIDGLPTYEAPEILPNGDIIIRRRHEPLPGQNDRGDGLTET